MFNFLNRLKTVTRLSIKPQQPMNGRHGVAIVAIVKNESKYISEWASFHFKAGISHFYIYDNGSTDETVDALHEKVPKESLTVIPWNQSLELTNTKQSLHNQVLAYAHAASNFGGQYRWMSFIDVDEFIVPKKDESILKALDRLGDLNNISLPWHMYGTSGHQSKPEGSVVENYKKRYANNTDFSSGLINYKCIVDPCKLTAIRVHSMQTGGEWRTSNDIGFVTSCKNRSTEEFYSSENLQLNHYYTRSKNEFLAKIKKGHILNERSVRYSEKLPKMLSKIDSDVVEDLCAIDFLNRLGI